MSDYTPPVGNNTNYMDQGWGSTNQTKQTARDIQHMADKNQFAIEMVESTVDSIDSVEKELIELSNAPNPPQPSQLSALAHRLDAIQRQVKQGLGKMKEVQNEIKHSSQTIQTNRSGW